MKRIEVKLSLPVVAPLLDVIKRAADQLRGGLASPGALADVDQELEASWLDELQATQNDEVGALLALFDDEFFRDGVIALDGENAEPILRASSAVRLRLRTMNLEVLPDETLEDGSADLSALEEPVQKAFMAYLFLATLQELIIQHLDSSILDS
ncbi:hypothetical protein K0B96_06195 [Horticoccus luteus]|uniref:DUF2017 domain-containing protein n=1 Tax=Horticoccus luteus TaxID=2862869 RepID=A0A8F9TXU4_9BACT|nr:hypothetical protein [Horticoccus luteus]QYM80203.1 hypothetical protein K0B96_06195 [Horticoccus luteus]